jgi:hypothetical protein
VNVAPGVRPHDAVTFAQLQAATSSLPDAAVSRNEMDSLRSALSDLHVVVKRQQALLDRQQERIAQLESREVAAMK